MHNHCFQFLLGNMGIIAVSREIEECNFLFFFGGGGGKSKLGALWPMWKWWTQYFCSVFSPSNYKFILRHLPVWFGVFQHWKQNIYFRFYGDDCWLHQRSTSTINTIILGLRRVVFYDGSNWLITMRGEVGLQKESLQISDYLSSISLRSLSRLFFCYGCLLQIKAKGKP